MKLEKAIWWILISLFVVGSILFFFHLWLLSAWAIAHPEYAAFIIGLLGFWLFANRLIFGYLGLTTFASSFLKGQELDKKELLLRARQKITKLEEWAVVSLLALWQEVLEPYKYAYYLAFFLVFVCTMLFELGFWGGEIASWVAKGLMFGAAIPTLLVFGLDLLTSHYVSEALSRESL